MYELVPLLAGIAAGIGLSHLRSLRVAITGVAGVALIAGVLASMASGELSVSALFLAWDVAQGAIAGFAALVLARRYASAGMDWR
jgi:hypothetical protein